MGPKLRMELKGTALLAALGAYLCWFLACSLTPQTFREGDQADPSKKRSIPWRV